MEDEDEDLCLTYSIFQRKEHLTKIGVEQITYYLRWNEPKRSPIIRLFLYNLF